MRRSSLYFEIWNSLCVHRLKEKKKKEKKRKPALHYFVYHRITRLFPLPLFVPNVFFFSKTFTFQFFDVLLCSCQISSSVASYSLLLSIHARGLPQSIHTYSMQHCLSLWRTSPRSSGSFFFLSLLNPLRYSLSFVSALAMKNSTVPTFLLDWHFSWLRLENLQRFRTKSKSVVILESMMEISYNCG